MYYLNCRLRFVRELGEVLMQSGAYVISWKHERKSLDPNGTRRKTRYGCGHL